MGCCCRKLTDAEKAALPECRKNLRSDSFPSEASNRTRCARCCACFASNIKFLLLFVATLGGAVLGYFLSDLGPFREPRLNPRIMLYFTFYAEVVTRILRFLALPVMVASLVSGVASLTTRISVKTAVIIGVYYAGQFPFQRVLVKRILRSAIWNLVKAGSPVDLQQSWPDWKLGGPVNDSEKGTAEPTRTTLKGTQQSFGSFLGPNRLFSC